MKLFQIISELFNDFKTKIFAFAGQYFAAKADSEKKFLEEQNEQKIQKLTYEENEKKQHKLKIKKKNHFHFN